MQVGEALSSVPGTSFLLQALPVFLARFLRALITLSTQEAQPSVRHGRGKQRPQLGSCSILLAVICLVEVLLVFYTVKFVHIFLHCFWILSHS